MPLKLHNLQPFKSFLLAEIKDDQSKLDAVGIAAKITDLLRNRDSVTEITDGGAAVSVGGLQTAFVYYKEQLRTPWTDHPDFFDITNHLGLVCCRDKHVAIYCSDPFLVGKIRKEIGSKKKRGTLRELAMIPAFRINGAFISGQTQALWLSGTHRRVASKVDNKVITGLDLRYALDPLADQTYFFTAARCRTRLKLGSQSLGISPRKSSIWAGRSSDWNDFAHAVLLVLKKIASQRRSQATPYPVLAVSVVDDSSRRRIFGAYDAALIPSEVLDSTSDDKARQDAEKWSQLRFEITPSKGANFVAKVLSPSSTGLENVGSVEFVFDLADRENVHWEVGLQRGQSGDNDTRLEEIIRKLNEEKKWLKVWYESGHVLAEQDIFHLRYREFPFRNYLWDDFGDYQRDQEKPKPLTADNIGREKSLFSWVKNCWRPDLKKSNPTSDKPNPARGWLASNDGSMEIADFIHFDSTATPPVLTLIHVKGANSNKSKRPISVSAYEIVTSQAVKNLRHIDEELLAGNFVNHLDKKIKEAVWHNGQKSDRKRMLKALEGINANYVRRVIILQPQTTRSALFAARKSRPADQLRAKQLDTLLLAAQASCQSLGAEFYVIGDEV